MISHIIFDHDGTLVNTNIHPKMLFEGIRDLLNTLRQSGIKLYVWTARDRRSTLEILKNLEILHLFEDISTASDGNPKPHPQGPQSMLCGIDPKDVVMVGDSYSDILGAKHFGCKSLGVTWQSLGKPDHVKTLKHIEADFICHNVNECKNILERLIKDD